MTESILTLEEVQAEFTVWRNNKEGHCPIPDELWHKVGHLLKTHPRARVLRALKLTTQQARSKGIIPPKIKPEVVTFVKVPNMESMISAPTCDLLLSSRRGDRQLSMKNVSIDHVKLIIDRFLG